MKDFPFKKDLNVDPYKPHGFLGDIVTDIKRFMPREQGKLAIAGALQIAAHTCYENKTVRGQKVNLMQLIIGPSASGKQAPQNYTNEVLSLTGQGLSVFGRIQSDKDIYQNLIDNDNRSTYVLDEVHGFFGSVNGRNAASYLKQAGESILALYSNSVVKTGGTHIRELENALEKKILKIQKKDKLSEGLVDSEIGRRISKLENQLQDLKEHGIVNPNLSMLGASTFTKLGDLISDDSLESGLLGRCILWLGDDNRARIDFDWKKPDFIDGNVLREIRALRDLPPRTVGFEPEAYEAARVVNDWFEDRANHEMFGAIYARGMDTVSKVAAISASVNRTNITIADLQLGFKVFSISFKDLSTMYFMNADNSSSGDQMRDCWRSLTSSVLNSTAKESKNSIARSAIKQKVFRSVKATHYKEITQIAKLNKVKQGDAFNFVINELFVWGLSERYFDAVGRKYWIINDSLNEQDPPEWFINFYQVLELYRMNTLI